MDLDASSLSRRAFYLAGFLVCAGLIGFALFLQHGLGLEPCSLCILQRVVVIALGAQFLVAAVHNPSDLWAKGYAGVQGVLGLAGAGIAGRQVWLQSLPKGQVPECGMSLDYMLDTLGWTQTLATVLKGTGECSEKQWVFLGLSIAGWALLFFVAFVVAAIAALRLKRR